MNTSPPLLKRRQFIRTHVMAAAGAALLPVTQRAKAQSADNANDPDVHDSTAATSAGIYRFTLGEFRFTVLSDGSFLVPSDIAPIPMGAAELQALNAEPAEREAFFRARLVPPDKYRIHVSPVIIENNNRRILVDAGWTGAIAPSTTGGLNAALDAAGVSRESINAIVITHCHPDHIGGLIDHETKEPRFPNAEIFLSDTELTLWMGDDAAETFRDLPLPLSAIQSVLEAVDDRLHPIVAGQDVAPGVRTIATPGHTTGHIAIGVDAGNRQLLIVGDSITTIHGAFEHPDWHLLFDMDPVQAGVTRTRLLDQAATDEMLLLGYHFPFPGLGCALRDGNAYRWYPAEWLATPGAA